MGEFDYNFSPVASFLCFHDENIPMPIFMLNKPRLEPGSKFVLNFKTVLEKNVHQVAESFVFRFFQDASARS